MDPLSLAFMGGSAILGGIQSSAANKQNKKIAMMNFNAQERAREDAIREAERQRAEARLGYTDARGNRYYFDPARGWVTELSDTDKHLDALQAREQQAVLENDLPLRRRQLGRNEVQQIEEGATARSLLDEFRGIRRENPETLRALLMDRARLGINEGADAAQSVAMRSALRTGNSNTGAIVEAMARARAKQMQEASLDADIRSRTMADENYNTRRNATAALYSAFGDRASRVPGIAYQPTDIGPKIGQGMGAFTGAGSGANSALLQAFGKAPAQMDYQQPDMGWANALASMGGMFQTNANQNRADARHASMIDLYRQRGTSGVY